MRLGQRRGIERRDVELERGRGQAKRHGQRHERAGEQQDGGGRAGRRARGAPAAAAGQAPAPA